MARRRPSSATDSVVVIGLGRFGGAVAKSLQLRGHEVLAIENDAELVESWSNELTYVVQADATDANALRQLGVHEFARAVVGIGTDIEASVLTVVALEELGVREIWAKAITENHGKILAKVGAGHVVFPERDMGERVAHLVPGKMIQFIEFDEGFAMAKTRAPRAAVGLTLREASLRSTYGITVVAVKPRHGEFGYATADTKVDLTDEIVVSGPTDKVEKFAAAT